MYFNVLSQKPTFATYPGAIHPGDDPGSPGILRGPPSSALFDDHGFDLGHLRAEGLLKRC